MSDSVETILNHLRRHIPDEVREDLINGLETAYNDAGFRYDRGVGSNGSTFGMDVYHFAVFQVARKVRESETGDVVHVSPSFRFEFGPILLGCHRVGAYASDSIECCFPTSEYAGKTLSSQLDLFEHHGVDETTQIGAVLAHRGNPEEGLLSVDICVPGSVVDSKIASWAAVLPLWTAGQETVESDINVSLMEIEEIARPAVVLRKNSK